MLNISRWKATIIILIAFVVCLCAVPISSRRYGCEVAEMGAAPRRPRLDLQGGSHTAQGRFGRRQEGEARSAARRSARIVRTPEVAHGAAGDPRHDARSARSRKDARLPIRSARALGAGRRLFGASGQRTLEVVNAGGGLIHSR